MNRDRLDAVRTHLANERTALAYVRTSLAFLAAGIGLIHFFPAASAATAGRFLVLAGAMVLVFGLARFLVVRRRIKSGEA